MRCTTGDGGILVAVIDVIVHATGKTRQAASNTWARMLTTDAYATVACQTQRLTFVGYTKKSSVTPVVPISVALSVVDHVTDRDQSAVSDVHRAIIAQIEDHTHTPTQTMPTPQAIDDLVQAARKCLLDLQDRPLHT